MTPDEMLERCARVAQEQDRIDPKWNWDECTPEYKSRMRKMLRAAFAEFVRLTGLERWRGTDDVYDMLLAMTQEAER